MPTAKVTSKGQITIPAEVREALDLTPGSRVQFVRAADGGYELLPASRSVMSLAGSLAPVSERLSIEEMEARTARSLADETRQS